MALRARLRSLLRGLLFRGRLEDELEQELRFHAEARADDLVRGEGLPRQEALRRARLELGWLETHKEGYRAARGLRAFDELRQDLLYALRSFRRNPGFTAVAVATLALGIGANTLFFTVVESVLLRPLPYREPERLVMVYSVGSFGPFQWNDGPLLDPDHLELRGLRALSGVAAFSGGEVTLLDAGDPARIAGAQVTPGLFPLLGEAPLLGRVFGDGERGVALLGEALWRGRFLADPGVLGRSVLIEGEPHTIVGVLPARFAFPPKAQLWRPLALRPGYWGNAMNRGIARLAPGVTHAQAQAQIETLLGSAAREAPENRRGARPVRVVDLRESLVGNVRGLLLVLLGVVFCVLLIGCANMANLLLARASARAQEMHVRASLGAGRGRLLRQLLTESAALAGLGGALGVLLVWLGLPALLGFVPRDMLPRIEEVGVNGGVLGFTLLVSLGTGLLFGCAPALFLLRGPAAGAQRPGASATRRERRLHGTLIVAETALVLVLLVGAGLLLRSFSRLRAVDPGFQREGLLTMSVWLPERGYPSPQAKRAFHERLLQRLKAEPELAEVSAINLLPFGSASWQGDFVVEGNEQPSDLIVGKPAVGPDYFRTLGIPLLRGRAFDARDVDGAPRAAIVSEGVARHCWPGQDPLGKRLTMDDPKRQAWREVVGVVGDVRQGSLAGKPQPAIYVPLSQEARSYFLSTMAFVARPRGDAGRAASALRSQLRAVDPALPPQRIELLDRLLDDSLAAPRLRTGLLLGFGLLSLLLALVGIHGVLSYEVSRRSPEIGVRRALGATTNDVLGLVLGRTLRLVGMGIALGLLGAAAATRSLQAFLFAVAPLDAATFGLVSASLLVTALLASLLPARRAARVDPATALRCE